MAQAPLKAWQKRMQAGHFGNWSELKRMFRSADYLSDTGLTVCNLGGNKYRLVAFIRFEAQTVYVKHIFTHSDYDQWNKARRTP